MSYIDIDTLCFLTYSHSANRPEFVGLSLDATSEVNQVQQEENGEE